MNILFISHLHGGKWAGPTYSVPSQVKAQKEIDNVLWYNLYKGSKKEWKELEYFVDLDNFPEAKISKLPKPFNKPDLVIFEQIYDFAGFDLFNEVIKNKIPYVLIPRSELTKAAQKRKRLKKFIANTLIFRRIIKRAKAVHYLTQKEKEDSGNSWNKTSLIIPNGTVLPEKTKQWQEKEYVSAVYIGRVEVYQKGLDLLVEAMSTIKQELIETRFHLDVFGPDRDNGKAKLKEAIKKASLEDLITVKEEVFDEEKEKELLQADVFVMTSRFEGLPMGMIEALSYGLPCFATEGTNLSNEIKRANAGWTAEVSVKSIATGLLKIVKEKEQFFEKSKNAVELAKEFSWQEIAKISHKEYKNLI